MGGDDKPSLYQSYRNKRKGQQVNFGASFLLNEQIRLKFLELPPLAKGFLIDFSPFQGLNSHGFIDRVNAAIRGTEARNRKEPLAPW